MKTNYSSELICGHCGRKGLARVLSEHSERDMETLSSPCGYLVKQSSRPWGTAYILSQCMHCEEIILTKIDWHDDFSPADYTYIILYPTSEVGNKYNGHKNKKPAAPGRVVRPGKGV